MCSYLPSDNSDELTFDQTWSGSEDVWSLWILDIRKIYFFACKHSLILRPANEMCTYGMNLSVNVTIATKIAATTLLSKRTG